MMYLAGAYTENPEKLYKVHRQAALDLREQGLMVLSPILQWHHVAHEMELPLDANYYTPWNFAAMQSCTSIGVILNAELCRSVGTFREVREAKRLHKDTYKVFRTGNLYACVYAKDLGIVWSIK